MSELSPLDLLDDPCFVFDRTGTVLDWNRAALDVTGYAAEELTAASLADLVEGVDVEPTTRVGGGDGATGGPEAGERTAGAELVTVDGTRLPHRFEVRRLPDDDGSVRFAGVCRDVHEKARRGVDTGDSGRVLREMYEITADRRRPFAEQVQALLGLGRAELDTAYGTLSRIEGENYVFEVVDADDDSIEAGDVVPLAATNCERAASDERTLVLGDVARDAPEQTDRAGYTEWGIECYIGAPVFVDDEVYGTFCFYDTEPRAGQFSDREVTLVDLMGQWVSYELQRRRTNERLRRQNERLQQFASIVSHDLRNPLTVLDGSLELFERTNDEEHLARAHRTVDRMDALVEDLLTLARSGATIDEQEDVDLGPLVERCWGHVPTGAATLEVEAERTVRADEARLEQLLENLIRNAVEHGGDSVTVRVGDLAGGFYLEDDGPGIPESEREAVFESGYTTSPEGTGFGLAIVEEIAEAHGWRVRVTESPEGGTRFEFTGVSTEARRRTSRT